MSASEWVVIHAGCAECGVDPLIEPGGIHPSLEAAKASVDPDNEWDLRWKEHPNGGVYNQTGEGSTWVAPLSALRAEERA